MKYIVKGQEPQAFSQWKDRENDDWSPTYDALPGKTKQALKESLMREQGFLCCYCERRVTISDSHIEHLRPQSGFPDQTLAYPNLLCSCQGERVKGDPVHCGHAKENWFDETLLISPLHPECENRFSFTGDGHIKCRDASDKAASETIRRLGLGIPKLKALRKAVIAPFLEGEMSEEERTLFVGKYLERDSEGRFPPFWTTIRYLFGYSSQDCHPLEPNNPEAFY
ncbi:MAG: retron system putative HNH endonuclease [Leptospirales bacterium]